MRRNIVLEPASNPSPETPETPPELALELAPNLVRNLMEKLFRNLLWDLLQSNFAVAERSLSFAVEDEELQSSKHVLKILLSSNYIVRAMIPYKSSTPSKLR